jgi:hypothetical protein
MTRHKIVVSAAMCVAIVGCSGGKPEAANSPEQAILQARKGLVDNKPAAIFAILPPTYQADINGLVADAATRMDAEVWNKGVGLIKKATGILNAKRDLILSANMMQSLPNPGDLKQNWSHGVAIIETLVKSDFANLERLRKGDVGALLAGPGATVMRQFADLISTSQQAKEFETNLDKVRNMTATVVSRKDDTAVVKIETKGEAPNEMEMVRVEGHWIPKDLAGDFKTRIAELRQAVAALDFTTSEGVQKKTMLMTQMGAIDAMLDQLAQANTKEAIDGVIAGMMMGLMAGQ